MPSITNGMQDLPAEVIALARRLAHNDVQQRVEALRGLQFWIGRKAEVSNMDMLKLWRGIFYCIWMADKAAIQNELSESLAEILTSLDKDRAIQYMEAFCETMAREWPGIDFFRVDKFYYFIRMFVRKSMMYCLHHPDRVAYISSLAYVFERGPLKAQDGGKVRGLALHIADIFIPELSLVLESLGAEHQLAFDLVLALSMPFAKLVARSRDDSVAQRCNDRVLSALCIAVDFDQMDEGESLSALSTILIAHAQELSVSFLELASADSTLERRRRLLYAVRKRFDTTAGMVADSLDAEMDDSSDDNRDDERTIHSDTGETDSPSENGFSGQASSDENESNSSCTHGAVVCEAAAEEALVVSTPKRVAFSEMRRVRLFYKHSKLKSKFSIAEQLQRKSRRSVLKKSLSVLQDGVSINK